MTPAYPRWKFGLILTVFSIFLWGAQPLAIAMIKSMSSSALAFYKIFSATLFILIFLLIRRRLPKIRNLEGETIGLLFLAAISLSISYFCFNFGFKFISPSNVQVYFQLSRIFMALAGVFFFKEVFNKIQWLGLLMVCLGLVLFFRAQLGQNLNEQNYYIGVALVSLAAATWALYAILQKALLVKLSSLQILALIYVLSTLLLTPYADMGSLGNLQSNEWGAFVFVCLSNVLAFACFSESLNHWESSKIATVSCLTPLVTITLMFFFRGKFGSLSSSRSLGTRRLFGSACIYSGISASCRRSLRAGFDIDQISSKVF